MGSANAILMPVAIRPATAAEVPRRTGPANRWPRTNSTTGMAAVSTTKEGKNTDTAATNAPAKLATVQPTKVAVMMIGPGVI